MSEQEFEAHVISHLYVTEVRYNGKTRKILLDDDGDIVSDAFYMARLVNNGINFWKEV